MASARAGGSDVAAFSYLLRQKFNTQGLFSSLCLETYLASRPNNESPAMPVYKITEKRLKKRQRQERDAAELEAALKHLQDASSGSEDGGDDEDVDGEESDEEDEDESDLESIGTMDSEDGMSRWLTPAF